MLTKGQKENTKSVLKWCVIALYMLISFAIMTTGEGRLARPLLLLPIVIAISLEENELVSGICGAFCGILVDVACGKLLGISAIFFLIAGVCSSFLFLHLLKRNLINTVLITALSAFIYGMIDFFFYYVLWGYDHLSIIFKKVTIPSVIFTIISSAVYYFIITKTVNFFKTDEGTIQFKGK